MGEVYRGEVRTGEVKEKRGRNVIQFQGPQKDWEVCTEKKKKKYDLKIRVEK